MIIIKVLNSNKNKVIIKNFKTYFTSFYNSKSFIKNL